VVGYVIVIIILFIKKEIPEILLLDLTKTGKIHIIGTSVNPGTFVII